MLRAPGPRRPRPGSVGPVGLERGRSRPPPRPPAPVEPRRPPRARSPGQPGFDEALVDGEGFPRADVDVARVRADRHRHACLRTDHAAILDRVQAALEALHAAAREAGDVRTGAPAAGGTAGPARAAPPGPSPGGLAAFAVVDEVSEGSPAAEAGLRLGDRVCAVGGADRRAFSDAGEALRAAGTAVAGAEGGEVAFVVLRAGAGGAGTEAVTVTVTPRAGWGGRGLLGCHLSVLR